MNLCSKRRSYEWVSGDVCVEIVSGTSLGRTSEYAVEF
jgi:hypothetical protein